MTSCAFLKCKNTSRNKNKDLGVTFHSFPSDAEMRHKWVQILRLERRDEEWTPNIYTRVCSGHFTADEIYMTKKGMRKINKNAVPYYEMKHVAVTSTVATPQNTGLKKRIRRLTFENKQWISKNKSLRQKHLRLQKKFMTLKSIIQNLEKKQLARRDPALVSTQTRMYFCEDHFDLPNDMENYMQYRIMGSVGNIRMKPGCLPSKFDCQQDRKRSLPSTNTFAGSIKKQRKFLIQDAENSLRTSMIVEESKVAEIEDKNTEDSWFSSSDKKTKDVAKNIKSQPPLLECRICLQKLSANAVTYNLFGAWALPWEGMEDTVAEDFVKLTNIQISETDGHSKILCKTCWSRLHDACYFVKFVKKKVQILTQRCTNNSDEYGHAVWPKPIQLGKTINETVNENAIDKEIKQEDLSLEECVDTIKIKQECLEPKTDVLEIKFEPEEIVDAWPMPTVNAQEIRGPLTAENREEISEESMYSEVSKLRLKDAVVYYEGLLAETNMIASKSSATISDEAKLIGKKLYDSTIEMLYKKTLVIETEMVPSKDKCDIALFEKDKSSDDYGPHLKLEDIDYIPLDYKIKVINIAKANPTWDLQTLQNNGCSRLKKIEYLSQWEKDVQEGGDVIDKHFAIDSSIYNRFVEARRNNQLVTNRILKEWALDAASQYPGFSIEFKALDRWISKFRERHGISEQKVTKFVNLYVCPNCYK